MTLEEAFAGLAASRHGGRHLTQPPVNLPVQAVDDVYFSPVRLETARSQKATSRSGLCKSLVFY